MRCHRSTPTRRSSGSSVSFSLTHAQSCAPASQRIANLMSSARSLLRDDIAPGARRNYSLFKGDWSGNRVDALFDRDSEAEVPTLVAEYLGVHNIEPWLEADFVATPQNCFTFARTKSARSGRVVPPIVFGVKPARSDLQQSGVNDELPHDAVSVSIRPCRPCCCS